MVILVAECLGDRGCLGILAMIREEDLGILLDILVVSTLVPHKLTFHKIILVKLVPVACMVTLAPLT